MTTQTLPAFGTFRYAETQATNADFDAEGFRGQWSRLVGSLHRHWRTRELVLCYSGRNPWPANIWRLKSNLESDPRNVGSLLALLDKRDSEVEERMLAATSH